ncbi:MAG: multicopper oxidase domain-containing protein [Myxococcales bacterium]|nr:multicopper oxidase domain-containing protein [Myxococcales bacterium]
MNSLLRFGFAAVLALLFALSATPARAAIDLQCPLDEDGLDTDGDGDPDNDNVCYYLGGGDGFINMADGALMYMFGFSDLSGVAPDMMMDAGMLAASSPAPTIEVREGQHLYINLVNIGMMMRPDLFDPHTVHFHGFPQAASVFDGLPEASLAVNMGSSITYYYNLEEPGTYFYHCHVEATEHIQMGMIGNLYVKPIQDMGPAKVFGGRSYTQFAYNDGDGSTGYDIEQPIQLTGFDPVFHEAEINIQPIPLAMLDDKYPLMNGRGYPDTINTSPLPNSFDGHLSQTMSSKIVATKGQRILLRVSNVSVSEYYTLATVNLPMQVIGRGAKLLRSSGGANLYYTTNSITIGGGEAIDVILDTANAVPGTYFLYSTNLNFLSNDQEDYGGLMTEIVINAPAAAKLVAKGGLK